MFEFERCLPEEVGIPSTAIRDLLEYLDDKDIPMHSLLIMRNDKLIFEKYYAPCTESTLHRMFSISKSFTALAISLLADEGLIDLDESITTYFPEYTNSNTHKWIKDTTIRNMLMMRTCHASTTYKVDMKSDWVESFFTVAPTHKPGTVFHYDTSAAHVLCALVEKETKMPMLDYLKERVLKHLDFSDDSYMVKDPFGVSIGGSGLVARPMDILKVLYLLDKKGTVICSDGIERTLLNPEFIELATSNLSPSIMTGPIPSESMGYGMQIWQNERGGFVMYGMGGQLAISIPSYKLLIMTTADTQGIAGGNQVIYDGIYNFLLPGIKNSHIGIKPGETEKDKERAYNELMKYADTLAISRPRIPGNKSTGEPIPDFIKALPTASRKDEINGQDSPNSSNDTIYLCYKLSDNPQKFKELSLELTDKGKSRLKLISISDPDTVTIDFSLSDMIEGNIKKYDAHYTAGATWLKDNDLYIRVHLIGECVGSIRLELFFGDDDITVFMRKIEETYFNEFNGHLYGKLL